MADPRRTQHSTLRASRVSSASRGRLNRGSLTLGGGVQISNNTGPGICADQNTGTSIQNVTVSNNSEEGVHVDRQSVAGFFQPLSITGNGVDAISCDSPSLIFGDLTGVVGITCQRIERGLGPPPARASHHVNSANGRGAADIRALHPCAGLPAETIKNGNGVQEKWGNNERQT